MPSLSVIVPCFNEEGSIGPFLRELADQAGSFSRFEIIVVDDASRDGSATIIRSLAADLPLRVITHALGLRVTDFTWVEVGRRALWLRNSSRFNSVFFCAEFLVRCQEEQPRMVEIELGYLPRRTGKAKNGSARAALLAAWHITRLFAEEAGDGRWHCLHPVAPDRPEPLDERRAA